MSSATAFTPDGSDASDGNAAVRRADRSLPTERFERLFLAVACAASIGFFSFAYSVTLSDPDYFARQMLLSFRPSDVDPITTGAIGADDSMPAQAIVRSVPPAPGDYQIVMLFEDEAILATPQELFRVKVGSVLPGLGAVLSIDPSGKGGIVETAQATLRAVEQ